jgi:hypothetical protein
VGLDREPPDQCAGLAIVRPKASSLFALWAELQHMIWWPSGTPIFSRSWSVKIAEHRDIDAALRKALRILPETELFKPIGDLLHRGSALGIIGLTRPHRQVYPTNPQGSRNLFRYAAATDRGYATLGALVRS